MAANVDQPVNLGNPDELSVLELAETILELTGSDSEIVYQAWPSQDSEVRRPDITKATKGLEWTPTTPLTEGLTRTVKALEAAISAGST